MGFRFRKSVKIMPGVRLNVSKTGASLSVGGRGATTNLSKRGIKSTFGIPGSGLSYTTKTTQWRRPPTSCESFSDQRAPTNPSAAVHRLSLGLVLGILLMPYIFFFFFLRQGYTPQIRLLSFLWMGLFLLAFVAP